MRINNNFNQRVTTNNQSFGSLAENLGKTVSKHPKLIASIAGLAGSTVIGQKIVMSGSEATIGPAMDIAMGKIITKASGEKDGRTNQSSKVQAIRTSAQAIGGTITGVIIRGICIAASTALLSKAGKNARSSIGKMLVENDKYDFTKNNYEFVEQMSKWGKNIGGALAILVMTYTNFKIDAPFINWINKLMTTGVDKISSHKKENQKEVK